MSPPSSPPGISPRQIATRQPLLWAALAASGGILAGYYLWRPATWWLVAGTVFLISAALLRWQRPHSAFTLAMAAIYIFEALSISLRCARPKREALPLVDGEDAVVTAHVIREERPRRRGRGDLQQKLDLETETLSTSRGTVPSHCGIRATFYSRGSDISGEDSPARVFHYGDRLRFSAKLTRPQNFHNPGAFDYQGYLEDLGISALASVKAVEVERLPGFSGSRFELWRTDLRRRATEQIWRLWPSDQATLVDSILVGDNDSMGRELLTDFQRTGTYHVLVISGLKVGILALASFWLLRRFRAGEITASAITVMLTVSYAIFTDVGTPVWRATLMLALYLCGRLLYRRKSALNAIGSAALVLLLIDPHALFDASFQLSFLCVLLISGIGSPILERTTRLLATALRNPRSTGYDFALPTGWSSSAST